MRKNEILREERNGLDKKQVLERVDAILMLTVAVQSGSMPREQALSEAQKLADEPFRTARKGFCEEDVQQYLRKLLEAF